MFNRKKEQKRKMTELAELKLETENCLVSIAELTEIVESNRYDDNSKLNALDEILELCEILKDNTKDKIYMLENK